MSGRRWIIAAVLLGPPLAVLGWKASHGLLHDPAPRLHDYANRGDRAAVDRGAYRSAEFCGGCHQEIYEQWQQSYLARSWTAADIETRLHQLTLMLKGTDPQEVRFCLECHAPLALAAPEDLDVQDPLSQEGVSCAVCHSAQAVWADEAPARMENDPHGPMRGPFADAVSPWHRCEGSSLFGDWKNELCGSCHSSKWPANQVPIDWTWQEWHEAAEPDDENCVVCHMPAYRGQAAQLEGIPERQLRDHSFPGGHDPDMVAEAVNLSFVGLERGPQGLKLKLDVQNMAGHDLPSGNPPAPEYRLRACAGPCPAEGGALDQRSYRASMLMADGDEGYDVTVAASLGPTTALHAWEVRREELVLPADLQGQVEVRLDFSYWRPYEPGQRWGSYLSTVSQHLGNPEVSLSRLCRTLARPATWELVLSAIGRDKGGPLPVDAIQVDLDSGRIAAQWSEGDLELEQ